MHVSLSLLSALLFVTLQSCMFHPRRYSIVGRQNEPVLLSPNVRRADGSVGWLKMPRNVQGGCSSAPSMPSVQLQVHEREFTLRVDASLFSEERPGSVLEWSAGLEERGCLPVGEGTRLVQAIVDGVPLRLSTVWSTLYPGPGIGYTDLRPGQRLKVTSPASRGRPLADGDSMAGYEVTWYDVMPSATGMSLKWRSSEQRFGDAIETLANPTQNFLRVSKDAAFFRLFYLARRSVADHDMALLGTATRSQLESQTYAFKRDPVGTIREGVHWTAIPNLVGVNPHIVVWLNGTEAALAEGTTVAQALRQTGVRDLTTVLQSLHIKKLYRGHPRHVHFTRSSEAVLTLRLVGGEVLRW
jgi:hypothetical protein